MRLAALLLLAARAAGERIHSAQAPVRLGFSFRLTGFP